MSELRERVEETIRSYESRLANLNQLITSLYGVPNAEDAIRLHRWHARCYRSTLDVLRALLEADKDE